MESKSRYKGVALAKEAAKRAVESGSYDICDYIEYLADTDVNHGEFTLKLAYFTHYYLEQRLGEHGK